MGLWSSIKKAAKSVANAVVETVEEAVDTVEETVDDIIDAAEDFVEDVKDTWNDALDDIKNATGFLDTLVAIVGGIIGGVIGTIGNVLDFVIDATGAIIGGIARLAVVAVGFALEVTITVLSLGYLTDFAEKIGDFFNEAGRKLQDWIATGFNYLGDFIETIFDIAANFVLAEFRKLRCLVQAIGNGISNLLNRSAQGEPSGINQIEHFFVLMLENRSFDHLLGHQPNWGVDGVNTGDYFNLSTQDERIPTQAGARASLRVDTPHEFEDVQEQLATVEGNTNGGFVRNYENAIINNKEDFREVMRGFTEKEAPVLYTLGKEFAVCDKWFSSLPGPTLPNRLFLYACTSGGLADSPGNRYLVWAMTMGGFEFDNGNIFKKLDDKCIDWRIYRGDLFPLVKSLKGIITEDIINGGKRIKDFFFLKNDIKTEGEAFPKFTFIEPDYGKFWSDFTGGNSQHPLDSIQGGEDLIREVYNTIRNSTIWNKSAIIITYDEHGGFYDHVIPPVATPPGDRPHYRNWAESSQARQFTFNKLGVRVPAVVVSPLIQKGTIDSRTFDHTSVMSTLSIRFGLRNLTERDYYANTLSNLFTLRNPRTDTPQTI